MKNKKGFTFIELLMCIAGLGMVLAILVPSIDFAIEKRKEKKYAKKHGIEYTLPMQKVKQEVRSERVSISKVAELDSITLYIAKDLNNGNEYLVTQFQRGFNAEGGVAVTLMPREPK